MKRILTVLFSVGAFSVSANAVPEKHFDDAAKYIFTNQQNPIEEENPYPIITEVETKKVNGENITLAKANGIPAFIAGERQTLLNIAKALDVSTKSIIKYNDMNVFDELHPNQIYYLKSKKRKGPIDKHTVIDETTLWEVSQRYGIKVKNLAKNNRMEVNDVLKRGRVLWLKKKRPSKVEPEYVDVPEPVVPEKPKVVEKKKEVIQKDKNVAEADTSSVIKVASDSDTFDPNASEYIAKENISLFKVSRMYNVTILDIKKWNGIPENEFMLSAGDTIKVKADKTEIIDTVNDPEGSLTVIDERKGEKNGTVKVLPDTPVKGGEVKKKQRPQGQKEEDDANYYIVKPTDKVLMDIATDLQISVANLQKWNNLRDHAVVEGQKLRITPPTQEQTQAVAGNQAQGEKGNSQQVIQEDFTKPAVDNTNSQTAGQGQSVTGIENQEAQSLAQQSVISRHIIAEGETLHQISKKYQVSIKNLRKWNKLTIQTPIIAGHTLFVVDPQTVLGHHTPTENTDFFSQEAADRPKEDLGGTFGADTQQSGQENSSEPEAKTILIAYRVKSGDTMEAVAARYKVTPESIRELNAMTVNQPLSAKKTVNIKVLEEVLYTMPAGSGDTQQESAAHVEPPVKPVHGEEMASTTTSIPVSHVIQKKETLLGISRKYGIPVKHLKKWNNLADGNIKYGAVLSLRDPENPDQEVLFHEIKGGDTLYNISKRYSTPIKKLKAMNDLTSDSIPKGTKLRVQ